MVTRTDPEPIKYMNYGIESGKCKAFAGYAMTLNIEKMRQRRHKLKFRTRFYVKNNAKVDLGRP